MFSRRDLLLAVPGIALGRPARGAPLEQWVEDPLQLQSRLRNLDGLETRTGDFFIRSHFGPPRWEPKRLLVVGGLVRTTVTYSPRSLRRLPHTELTTVLQCSGNGRAFFRPPVPGLPWFHGAMGQARWTGVRLATLLERSGIRPGAAHVHLYGADRPPRPQTPPFIRSLPLEKALHPDTLVAWAMNGELLSLHHGAPLRLVVPCWAGAYWVKWLVGLEVAAEPHTGYFVQRAYRVPPGAVPLGAGVDPGQTVPVAAFPVKSVITFPAEDAALSPGPVTVRGVAFSGEAALRSVELTTDGGHSWMPARLEGPPGSGRWQRFHVPVDARPGLLAVAARASDATGAVQPEFTPWNPSGHGWNGWHRVSWRVHG